MPLIDTATLRIIKYPDPRLRQVCRPVERLDDALRALAARMLELTHAARGVGLAAPQVGVLIRMFVCSATGEEETDQVFINPELTDLQGQTLAEEGCLSIPEVMVNIRRATSCKINARNLDGKPIEAVATDLVARCWQHECDHIDGRLITDRMSEAEKIANRRAIKALEASFKLG